MRIAKASVELATAPQFDVPLKLRFGYRFEGLVKDFVNK
jgi:hypothetical protein